MFVARALVVAMLATLVILAAIERYDLACPKSRFAPVGHSPDGREVVVFDACLGVVYATPVVGAKPKVQPQKKDTEV